MSSSANKQRISKIHTIAEEHFGKAVKKITAPGGEGRSSFRLHFEDRNVIATLRPNFRRTHLEAYVLNALIDHCDDLPRCLGVVDDVMFQEDVGGRRLNREIVRHSPSRQLTLSAEAIEGIFRIQSAARKTDLHEKLPHLGTNQDWILNFVNAVDALRPFAGGISSKFDHDAACEAVMYPGRQFLKWDCRSGNAAIGDDRKLRWFDFEYSGLRHGAEDIAWLIGDEAWPVEPEEMADIVVKSYDPETGHDIDDYMEFLSIYLTFHCVQRFKLITKEAKKRGWLTKEKVRKYDDAGVHPDFAAHICKVGAYFASRAKITAPLARNFEGAESAFSNIGKTDPKRKSA